MHPLLFCSYQLRYQYHNFQLQIKRLVTFGKDVIVMGFDCNKWALEELLAQNWNYDGQCNPFQASYIDEIIKTIEGGSAPAEKVVIMEEKGFDAETITQEDVDTYGI